ncbi:hypothetical protein KP509_04G077000 [Ceratopteris richardii]|uniref:Uncharacterized protein n=1 Tax=Ceratopteris richardii TaxID=49495 RepID=A0A8T2V0R4_CERRI|nr:hypothetical protein KP509_04G077000 [Ceratopteris richardii]
MQSAKKKQRVSSSSRLSSLAQWVSSPVHDHRSEPTRVEFVELDTDGKLKKGSCNPLIFNDPAIADVVLFLHTYNTDIDDREHCSSTEVYLHACALEQYFKGLIKDVSTALSCLPVAAEWLYDECIAACVQVLDVVTSLQLRESAQLLARITPVNTRAVHDMLGELVYAAIHSHPNGATVKAFVARLLNDYSSRSTVKLVLDGAFANSLKTVKDSVEEYSSPNVRGRHDEIEALQRVSLHTASLNSKHLLWLVKRMIELRVADKAVSEWSEQVVFTANLLRVFNDDAWRTIAPSLPALVLRCTFRLASAVATGSMIATCQNIERL